MSSIDDIPALHYLRIPGRARKRHPVPLYEIPYPVPAKRGSVQLAVMQHGYPELPRPYALVVLFLEAVPDHYDYIHIAEDVFRGGGHPSFAFKGKENPV
jgi:hypothetical protein